MAGILTGAIIDIGWLAFLSSTGIYEIIPGFVLGGLAAIVVSLCSKAPTTEVEELFERAVKSEV